MSGSPHVLVVDDAGNHGDLAGEIVRFLGSWPDAAIDTARSFDAALEALQRASYDVALVDDRLGYQDTFRLIRDVKRRGIETPVILVGCGAEDLAGAAIEAGAADYLSKSNLSVETVSRAVRYVLAIRASQEQQRNAEVALRVTEQRFHALLENSWEVALLLDGHARIVEATPSAERHFEWRRADIIGSPFSNLVHPEDRKALSDRYGRALARPGEQMTTEVRLRHADGSYRSMDGIIANRLQDPAVGSLVFNARDVTEGRRLAAHLQEAQKLEAVGRLAGGVAHDFNNLLTAILGYCNLALEDTSPDEPQRRDLEEIRRAGERAAALTRQLLAFSRRQALQPESVDLSQLVTRIQGVLRRTLGDDIELVMALGENLPPITADPALLEQAIGSLAINARDAMPLGGRLFIETQMTELDESYAASHVVVTPGRYMMLAMTDTGKGMDGPIRARVFEPFFTTTAHREDSGLGLATVYGIVKQSGGHIWVYSEPGHGTTFKIYLPLFDQSRAAMMKETGLTARRGAAETILLVEDEDAVRSVTCEALMRQGYVVVEAVDGPDALKVAESYQAPIHLLITDIEMPLMSGRELANRLSQLRPSLKVLFMSGYPDRAVVHLERASKGVPFLQKPFTPALLGRRVRSLLDTRPS